MNKEYIFIKDSTNFKDNFKKGAIIKPFSNGFKIWIDPKTIKGDIIYQEQVDEMLSNGLIKVIIQNPSAFPNANEDEWVEGMTLRDYFAGQVMSSCQVGWDDPSMAKQAQMSYRMADAMLKERMKK